MDEISTDVVDVGTVISLGDGIARIYGCEACLAGELRLKPCRLSVPIVLHGEPNRGRCTLCQVYGRLQHLC